MIMFRLFQNKSLMVKLFWRVDPKTSMTSRVLWVFIFSFSFLTIKVFFLSLIKYCTLLRAFFVIFMISALSRLLKFGK